MHAAGDENHNKDREEDADHFLPRPTFVFFVTLFLLSIGSGSSTTLGSVVVATTFCFSALGGAVTVY